MSDKARQKARRMADFSPPTSLEYRVKHYSIESTIEYSILRELPIENLGKVLLDC